MDVTRHDVTAAGRGDRDPSGRAHRARARPCRAVRHGRLITRTRGHLCDCRRGADRCSTPRSPTTVSPSPERPAGAQRRRGVEQVGRHGWDRQPEARLRAGVPLRRALIRPGTSSSSPTPDSPLDQEATRGRLSRSPTPTPNVGGRYSALTAFGLVPRRTRRRRRSTQLLDEAEAAAADRRRRQRRTTRRCGSASPLGVADPARRRQARARRPDSATGSATRSSSWSPSPPARSTRGCCRSSSPSRTPSTSSRAPPTRSWSPWAPEAPRRSPAGRRLTGGWRRRCSSGRRPRRWPDSSLASTRSTSPMSRAPSRPPAICWAAPRLPAARPGSTGVDAYGTTELRPRGAVADLLDRARPVPRLRGHPGLPGPHRPGRSGRRPRVLAPPHRRPVTFGWGPRFLHSTGQYHKGGTPTGVFLQITCDPVEDLAVPVATSPSARSSLPRPPATPRCSAGHGRPVLRLISRTLGPPCPACVRLCSDEHPPEPAARPAGPPTPPDCRSRAVWCCSASPATSPREAHPGHLRPGQPRPAAAGFALVGFARHDFGREGFAELAKDAAKAGARTAVARDGLEAAVAGVRFVEGSFDDDAAWEQLADDAGTSSTSSRAPRQPRVLPVDPARLVPGGRLPAQEARTRHPANGGAGAGSSSRSRSDTTSRPPRSSTGRRRRLPARERVPHRPLPRQRDGAEHPGVPLRQRDVRADLERQLRRPRADHHGRGHRHRHAAPATTTASAPRATSSRTTCCS